MKKMENFSSFFEDYHFIPAFFHFIIPFSYGLSLYLLVFFSIECYFIGLYQFCSQL